MRARSHSFKLNRTTSLLLGAAVLGVLAFAIGVAQSPQHTWKIFLVNFLFWSGISISGVVFSAIFQLTKARWAVDRVRTVAESFACFLPLSLLLYLLLMVLGAGISLPLDYRSAPGQSRLVRPALPGTARWDRPAAALWGGWKVCAGLPAKQR